MTIYPHPAAGGFSGGVRVLLTHDEVRRLADEIASLIQGRDGLPLTADLEALLRAMIRPEPPMTTAELESGLRAMVEAAESFQDTGTEPAYGVDRDEPDA